MVDDRSLSRTACTRSRETGMRTALGSSVDVPTRSLVSLP
jgi:hypothetical protein